MVTKITNTDEIRDALRREPAKPLRVQDDVTQQIYVILTDEQYQRVRCLLEEGDFDIRETYAAQDEALRKAGWDDPALDVYNDYDVSRNQP